MIFEVLLADKFIFKLIACHTHSPKVRDNSYVLSIYIANMLSHRLDKE